MKTAISMLFVMAALTSAWALTLPLPGEYTGQWRGHPDREFGRGVQTQAVHLTITTNGEVILWLTLISPITGATQLHRIEGTVRRNGIIRGGDNGGRFRAVRREKGQALRGLWYFPTRYGPVGRLRFYARRD